MIFSFLFLPSPLLQVFNSIVCQFKDFGIIFYAETWSISRWKPARKTPFVSMQLELKHGQFKV